MPTGLFLLRWPLLSVSLSLSILPRRRQQNPGVSLWSRSGWTNCNYNHFLHAGASQIQNFTVNRRKGRKGRAMPRAILLKTKSSPIDPYDTAFRCKTPFIPVFIPVLQHARVNTQELRNILEHEPDKQYTALIVTSQRAVEALGDAMAHLSGNNPPPARPRTRWSERGLVEQLRELRGMMVYTVGPATAIAMTKLEFSTICGADTGNGMALANLIVQTFRREPEEDGKEKEEATLPPRLPLLFLVGDKRRDVIPKRLAGEGIPLEELVVYETTVAPTFETDLDRVLAESKDGDIEWVIFFSPMGAEIALRQLDKLPRKVRVGTIGPTTAEYLRKEWGITPDMVSKKPEPISMVQGILEHV